MEPKAQFAANLRALRTDRGWSQETLADRSDLHSTEISRLERGVRDPRLQTITRLAQALGVSVAELVAGIA